ncbi:MAG: hypothetical protein ACJA08_001990 [Cyclobacteriaceae bacterium]|jgi:hypothetical protein
MWFHLISASQNVINPTQIRLELISNSSEKINSKFANSTVIFYFRNETMSYLYLLNYFTTFIPTDEVCDNCYEDGGGYTTDGTGDFSKVTYGPLMDTEWNQDDPYNFYARYMNCSYSSLGGKAWAGCVAVAMAQIVNYCEYPTGWQYEYDEMGTGDAGNLAIAHLMGICANYVNMDYGCNSSSASTSKAVNVFKNDFGYSNEADYRDFDVYKVVSDIQRSRPVLLRGCRTSKKVLLWFTYSDCHAWVCDGARLITSRNTTVRYMHMNWGWGNREQMIGT